MAPTLPRVVNRIACDHKRSALYHNQNDLGATVGPLYIPDFSACYASCFSYRRAAALSPWESALLEDSRVDTDPLPLLLAADWLVIETTKRVTGVGTPISHNRVLYVDYLSGVPEVHTILRVPRCTVCGPHLLPDRQIWLNENSPFERDDDDA